MKVNLFTVCGLKYLLTSSIDKGMIFNAIVGSLVAAHKRKNATSTKMLRVMKLTAILLFIACIHVSAHGLAQDRITFSGKEVPLEKVFSAIKKQTSYTFLYREDVLQNGQKVSISVKNATIEDVMDICVRNQPFRYVIKDKLVYIVNKEKEVAQKPLTTSFLLLKTVSGRIINQNSEPVVGATVTEKGTKNSTNTGNDGEFSLAVNDLNATIVVSSVNVETHEYKLGGSTNVIVSVFMKISKLDEVEIVAYGTNTQRFQTGSVSKVAAEEITSQPVSNPLAALEGRVPGLVVSQTSGIPGGSFKIQIRGQNSLPPSTSGIPPLDNPLFIIDGVPFAPNNSNVNQFPSIASPTAPVYNNPYGGISPFNSINPSDIESIVILKDADATAIYGSRGANGVILITTKRAKSTKLIVNGNVYTGQSRVTRTQDMMNTAQYVEMRHEALRNAGQIPTRSNSPDLFVFDTTKYTNWKKIFLGGTASTVDANASIAGGNEGTKFLIGESYHRETYIFPGDFSNKVGSVNLNLGHNSTDKRLQLDFSSNYSYGKNNSSGSANSLLAFTLLPNYPDLIDSKGNLVWTYKGVRLSQNPLQYLKQKYTASTYNLISHFQIGYNLLPGLMIRSSFGYNKFDIEENSINPISAQNPDNNPLGSLSFGTNNFKTWIIEPQLEYDKNISKGALNILVGGTLQQNSNTFSSVNASGYQNDALLGSLAAASSINLNSAGASEYKYAALFGRVRFIWNKKYIASLTGRRDGSSRFGPGKQIGNFGSIGGGWIFSEEHLIKEMMHFLSYGKIRASYGITGSDQVGDYQFIDNWQPITPPYNGTTGFQPINLFNSNFSWAVTKKLETGLELAFLSDRIVVNASWYRNRCGNQLITYTLPSQTGFTGVVQNFPAIIENSGWEFQLFSSNIKSKQFTWSTSINFSIPKNKLLSFPGIENTSYAYDYVVGKSLNTFKRFHYIGVDPSTGIFNFSTHSGNSTTSPDPLTDRTSLISLDPKFYGGFKNTFSYNNFQLEIFLDFRKQIGTNYLQQIYGASTIGSRSYNEPTSLLSRWRKTGDNSQIQQFNSSYSSDAYNAAISLISSDAIYSDASFVRFKTISISYILKNNLAKKIAMSGIRIYMTAQNLFTITNYKGNDPETQNYYGVPPLKTFVAGLQFTL